MVNVITGNYLTHEYKFPFISDNDEYSTKENTLAKRGTHTGEYHFVMTRILYLVRQKAGHTET